jgi:hypothetical protein
MGDVSGQARILLERVPTMSGKSSSLIVGVAVCSLASLVPSLQCN